MRRVPLVGGDVHATIFMVEDLPAPLGPRKPNDSPRRTSMLIPFTRQHIAVRFRQVAGVDHHLAACDLGLTHAALEDVGHCIRDL